MAWLANAINPGAVYAAAVVAALYGILHMVEGWGLWRAKAWASWLGCLSAALYLPFDVYTLLRHPGWLPVVVDAVNLMGVWVLGRDLFVRRRRPRFSRCSERVEVDTDSKICLCARSCALRWT